MGPHNYVDLNRTTAFVIENSLTKDPRQHHLVLRKL